jgi:catechol 2,3-dioxygenase-like lactoylglutathione lyase family enzyme
VSTQARPLVSRLNVVYLYVRAMDRSLAFYRDLLGIPLEGDSTWTEAQLGSTRFALHLAHEGVGDFGSGTVHLDFEVGSVDKAVERLRAADVEVHETMRAEWGAAAEAVDPDGYRIALFEPPP